MCGENETRTHAATFVTDSLSKRDRYQLRMTSPNHTLLWDSNPRTPIRGLRFQVGALTLSQPSDVLAVGKGVEPSPALADGDGFQDRLSPRTLRTIILTTKSLCLTVTIWAYYS